ncbi:hypothetical protein IJ750_00435 [bacterium]|nr:hypothetical protein [bacterium]
MALGTTYNTTINVNGRTVHSCSYNSPFGYGLGCCMPGVFGYGFGVGMNPFGCCGAAAMIGAQLGYGLAGSGLLGGIFKGIGTALGWCGSMIGKGASFLWNKALKPVCSFAWNKVLKPAGKAVWNGLKWCGSMIGKGAKAIANGVKSLWNKIFHRN